MASFSSSNITIVNGYQGWYENSSNDNTLKLNFTTARDKFIGSLGSNNISNISIDNVTLYLKFGGAGGDRKKSLNISLLNNTTTTSSIGSVTTAAEAYNSTTYVSLNGSLVKTWFKNGTSPYYLTSTDPAPGESDRTYSYNYLSVTEARIEITWSVLKSSLTSYPSVITLGKEYTYTTSSSYYYHKIYVYIKEELEYISDIQDSKKITLDIDKFGPSFTENQTSLKTKIRLITFPNSSNLTSLGYREYSVTLKLPENDSTKPTIKDPITITTPSDSILKNLTPISFKITTSAKFNAKVENYKLTFDKKTYSSSNGSFSEIIPENSGDLLYTVTITDSRGFSNSEEGTVYGVLDYFLPSLTNIEAQRCDSSGTITEDGTQIKITATGNFYGDSATVKIINSAGKPTTDSKPLTTTDRDFSHITSTKNPVKLDSSYSRTIIITDEYNQSVSYPLFVGSISYLLHFRTNRKSVGIGCAAPDKDNQLDIAWPVNLQSGLTSALQVEFGGTGASSLLGAQLKICDPMTDTTSTAITDNSLFVFRRSNPTSVTGVFTYKNASTLWTYIKGKADGSYLPKATVQVEQGGTGATTEAGAREKLGTNNAANITEGTLAAERLPFKIAYGSGNVSGSQTLTIDYSSTNFNSIPKVVVSYSKEGDNWSGDNGVLKISNKTKYGAKIVVGGDYNTLRAVDWIAIGK